MTEIEIFGKAEDEICSGCEHDCGDCSPGDKKRTIDLVNEFSELINKSEFNGQYSVAFYESTKENIAKYKDVQQLLSMASLEPVICIGGSIAYLGGFSPEGLLEELRKKKSVSR